MLPINCFCCPHNILCQQPQNIAPFGYNESCGILNYDDQQIFIFNDQLNSAKSLGECFNKYTLLPNVCSKKKKKNSYIEMYTIHSTCFTLQ